MMQVPVAGNYIASYKVIDLVIDPALTTADSATEADLKMNCAFTQWPVFRVISMGSSSNCVSLLHH